LNNFIFVSKTKVVENFKMDRTIVSKSTFKEADDHVAFYKDKTPLEKFRSSKLYY
jgi:hypothetical protein